jgi:hypothetical protein
MSCRRIAGVPGRPCLRPGSRCRQGPRRHGVRRCLPSTRAGIRGRNGQPFPGRGFSLGSCRPRTVLGSHWTGGPPSRVLHPDQHPGSARGAERRGFKMQQVQSFEPASSDQCRAHTMVRWLRPEAAPHFCPLTRPAFHPVRTVLVAAELTCAVSPTHAGVSRETEIHLTRGPPAHLHPRLRMNLSDSTGAKVSRGRTAVTPFHVKHV